MRFVIGQINHETHVFSPIRTDDAEFRKRGLHRGEEILRVFNGTSTHIGGFMDVAKAEGAELIPTITAAAKAGGLVAREVYDGYLGELLEGIKEAGKIDGVLLSLHGAGVVEGIDDLEGHVLRSVRELVGDGLPVVATLDLHANITREMIDNVDAFHVFDTYPHVDAYEQGVQAAHTIIGMARGEIKPVMGFKETRLMPAVVFQRTGSIPMSTVFEYVRRLEDKYDEVIDISVAPGFPWSDFPGAGYSVVTVVDGNQELAQELAEEVAELSWNLRRLFDRHIYSPEEAVREAMRARQGPVVMADISDNPDGGGSCDGVEIVRAMVKLGAKNAAVAVIADPAAVAACIEAGVGKELAVSIGAKTDEFHGRPLNVKGKVRLISDGTYMRKGPMGTGLRGSMGRTAVLDVAGIEILVTERRTGATDAEIFRSVGIEPLDKQMLLLKSSVHFRAAFEPLARGGVLEVAAPGLLHPDLSQFPFKRIRRPIFPLDPL